MHCFVFVLFAACSLFAAEPGPLPRAHAHNDYEHTRPLLDALAQGFGSVEADVHLIGGKLLVAHDAKDAAPDHTLASLYLDPLRARAEANGGRIYRGGPSIILLVDLKTEAEPTYEVLKQELARYPGLFTRFTADRIETNAVTVILSGNRPRATLLREKTRLVAFDGRLADLDQNLPLSFMPLVSDNWRSHFKWDGHNGIPEDELARLKTLVARVHAEKRLLRFWATPDTVEAWKILSEQGVDLLNTDDLSGLAEFLRSRP